jgi:hypothetical protein
MKMKKIIIIALLAVAFLFSCKQEDIVQTKDQVGISKVTYYPILTLLGDEYIVLASGSAFTDPGATAEAGGVTVDVSVSGTIDSNTPGVYLLTYVAVNKDGFSASVNRFVVVYSTDASAAANDFSGSYARTSNGQIAVWTKIAPGVYMVLNPGGAAGTSLTVIAFNPTGYIINVPSQPSSDGSITSCTNADGGSDVIMDNSTNTYAWHVVNPGYGTALRTFVKQ